MAASTKIKEFKTGLEQAAPTEFPPISISSYDFDQKIPGSDYRNRKKRTDPKEQFETISADRPTNFPKSPG